MARAPEHDLGWYKKKYLPDFELLGIATLAFQFDQETQEESAVFLPSIEFPSGFTIKVRKPEAKNNLLLFFANSMQLPYYQHPDDAYKKLQDPNTPSYREGWKAEKVGNFAKTKTFRLYKSQRESYEVSYGQTLIEAEGYYLWHISNVVPTKG